MEQVFCLVWSWGCKGGFYRRSKGPEFGQKRGGNSVPAKFRESFVAEFVVPGVVQSGFRVNFLFWSGKFSENCRRISQRILMANFDSEFFGLVFPGFQATPKKFTPKIHVQNCRHSSPISLSRTQNLFTAIFCLRGRPGIRAGESKTAEENLSTPQQTCVFPVEPQRPNGKNMNLHKKWGFHRFQKVCRKVPNSAENRTFCAKSVQKMRKKCGSPHFSALFGTLPGIGGNPTFCADQCFCRLASEARQEIHNSRLRDGRVQHHMFVQIRGPERLRETEKTGSKGPLDPMMGVFEYFLSDVQNQRNPRAHENKIGTSPPPRKPKFPPPQNEEFYGHGGFPTERRHFFRVSIKLAQPFPAPELRTQILRTRGYF